MTIQIGLTKDWALQPIVDPALPLGRALDFELPAHLSASEPPEARGLARDEVRLMVSHRSGDTVEHTRFRQIGDYLTPGDVLVINTSGTLNAALTATRADGEPLELHLSTRLPGGLWVVEARRRAGPSTQPFFHAHAGETLRLPGGATATLHAPYRLPAPVSNGRGNPGGYPGQAQGLPLPTPVPNGGGTPGGYPGQAPGLRLPADRVRLWVAGLSLPRPCETYLAEYGFPIRYSYVKQGWPLSYYQTVYATEPGSAEMPSAGRAFTTELVTRLVAQGVQVMPLVLHTGVASLEEHEPPYEEYYRVPPTTAQVVNQARAARRRVIAVGTTVVRALETVTDAEGVTGPGEGWTRLVITPERGLRAVNGLLTGLHEPRATHLAMLEALAGLGHLQVTYAAALAEGYLWHEFGDLHLILP